MHQTASFFLSIATFFISSRLFKHILSSRKRDASCFAREYLVFTPNRFMKHISFQSCTKVNASHLFITRVTAAERTIHMSSTTTQRRIKTIAQS